MRGEEEEEEEGIELGRARGRQVVSDFAALRPRRSEQKKEGSTSEVEKLIVSSVHYTAERVSSPG